MKGGRIQGRVRRRRHQSLRVVEGSGTWKKIGTVEVINVCTSLISIMLIIMLVSAMVNMAQSCRLFMLNRMFKVSHEV